MKFYTMKEVAEKTGLHYDQIWYHAMTNKITPAIQVGRSRLFSAKNIRQIQDHFHKKETNDHDRNSETLASAQP